jgi:ankyrin repeat protein
MDARLSWATWFEHEEVVTFLLEKGADIHSRDKDQRTPLYFAAVVGNEYLVRLLLEKGSYIDVKDHIGESPLSRAIEYGSEEVVRLLLEKGADINLRDNDGRTPLELAEQEMISWKDDDTSRAAYEDIVNLLKERGGIL